MDILLSTGPTVLLHRTAFQQVSPQPLLVPGVAPSQVQDPEFAFDGLDWISPETVQVSLKGRTAFWCVSHLPQFCIICKLAEGDLCPFIQVFDE